MDLDEKALEIAQDKALANAPGGMTTWSLQLHALIRLAIEVYEQTRERVAVPSVESLRDEWEQRHQRAVPWNIAKWAHGLLAAQRPAPTTERVSIPSREEIAAGLSTAYQASELNADEALEFDDIPEDERERHLWMADYVLTLLRPDPSAQPWTRELCQKLYASFVPYSRHSADSEYLYQAGVVHFGPTAPVASAQGGDDFDARADALLKRMESHEAGTYKALERDLAAECAAHQTTKADCERRMNDWQDTHEQEVEQLKDDLATERAAHEATKAELANEYSRGRADSNAVFRGKLADASEAISDAKRDAVDWKLKAHDFNNLLAAEREAHRLTADAKRVAMERAAELERERDEARGKLDALIASVVAVTREAPNVNSAWLAGEIRKLCTSALAQEGAKPAEPQRFVHEPDCMQPDNHDCACPSPVAEPKPDDEHRCKIDAPAYLNKCECGATLNDLFDKHRIAKPAEPEPGDVLSGEAAKAYMLANPGRRVRDSRWQRSWYAAVDGVVKTGDGVHTWGPADAFHGDMGEYAHARYIVLPPEPAKPATPDLGLAAVTVRVDELELTALQLLERVTKLEGK